MRKNREQESLIKIARREARRQAIADGRYGRPSKRFTNKKKQASKDACRKGSY
jgi:hypothetical protein